MQLKVQLAFEETPSGCFEVVSHVAKHDGYCYLAHNGLRMPAHRFVWEECFGPIPNGKVVCHSCDNRKCINPEHLWIGTQGDNLRDMYQKGRGRGGPPPGERNPSSKLSLKNVQEIRKFYQPRHPIFNAVALSRKYNVHPTSIRNVLRRKTWAV